MNRFRQFTRGRFVDDERGVVIIIVAVVMVVTLGFLALVVDLGNGRQTRRQAQASADASAIAAAEEIASMGGNFTGSALQWAQVIQVAKQYAWTNYGTKLSDWVGCTDPGHLDWVPDTANNNSCISADRVGWPNPQPDETVLSSRIRIQTPTKTIPTIFGGAVDAQQLSTQAVAMAGVTRKRSIVKKYNEETHPGGPCAICVLGPGFAFDGQNGDITVTGGGVVVNADPSTGNAASLNPNGSVRVTAVEGIGGPGAPSKWYGSGFDPDPITKAPVDDPLAALPMCPNAACPTEAATASTYTLNPGVYTSITGSHKLNPGTYVIKTEVRLSGNDVLIGNGVTLFFACSNYPNPCSDLPPGDRDGARIRATGNGAVLLTAPTSGTYQGLTIFADRENTSTFTFRGNGTNENGSAESSSGTIYMKSGTFDLRGNGYTLASQIITGQMTMQGNPSGINVFYDLSKNAPEATTIITQSEVEALSYDATGLCNTLPCEDPSFPD